MLDATGSWFIEVSGNKLVKQTASKIRCQLVERKMHLELLLFLKMRQ